MLRGPLQCARELGPLYAEQARQAADLLETLERERATLAVGDVEPLENLAERKTAALQALERLHQKERSIVDSVCGQSGQGSVQAVLDWCDPERQLHESREKAMAAIASCHRQNLQNGVLVQQRLNYVRRALDVLDRADSGHLIYEADGRTGRHSRNRLLARG
jgi:flagellar biosynthesis/type III secretory pathway chaperone